MADADDDGSIDPLDVGAFIRSQRERAEMSIRRLAELAEVSNPYLSQIERGLRKPSAEILQQIANAMRISVETLYVRALTLGSGSTLDLGGLTLYVGAISDAGGNITGGQLSSMIPGDCDNDFRIDGADLALWQQHYDPLGLNGDNNTWALGDWNHDDRIDGGDLAIWQQNYDPLGSLGTGGPAPLATVPEPASVLLVLTGAAGLGFIRKRK